MQKPHVYIDLSYLRDFSNGSEEFVKEIITIYLKQTGEETVNLGHALQRRDYKIIRQTCHKLKSSMNFMGLDAGVIRMLELLERIEEEDADVFSKYTGEIIRICAAVNQELQVELQSYNEV